MPNCKALASYSRLKQHIIVIIRQGVVLSTNNESTDFNTSSELWKAKLENAPGRKPSYSTLSQIPVHPLYTPNDLDHSNSEDNMEMAGEFPYL